MDYLAISVFTTQQGLEIVSAKLDSIGISQVEIVDDIEEVKRILEQSSKYWDYVDYKELLKEKNGPCVRVYAACNDVGEQQLEDIIKAVEELKTLDAGIDLGSLSIEKNIVREDDWANSWKQFYKPIAIGDKLLVKPVWEDLTDEADGRLVVNIESGLVFGTGQHESTQLCLELLEQQIKGGEEVLDIGCGTGVLFMAALMLGAQHAVAVDVDGNARQVVDEHSQYNDISKENYEVYIGDAVEDIELKDKIGYGKYDIVLANIVADVILALLPSIKDQLKPGAKLISSGIIGERLGDIKAGLEANGLTLIKTITKNDWVGVLAERKA